jgi:hypothetical protein
MAKMYKHIIQIIALFEIITSSSAATPTISCKDPNGNNVDWCVRVCDNLI